MINSIKLAAKAVPYAGIAFLSLIALGGFAGLFQEVPENPTTLSPADAMALEKDALPAWVSIENGIPDWTESLIYTTTIGDKTTNTAIAVPIVERSMIGENYTDFDLSSSNAIIVTIDWNTFTRDFPEAAELMVMDEAQQIEHIPGIAAELFTVATITGTPSGTLTENDRNAAVKFQQLGFSDAVFISYGVEPTTKGASFTMLIISLLGIYGCYRWIKRSRKAAKAAKQSNSGIEGAVRQALQEAFEKSRSATPPALPR